MNGTWLLHWKWSEMNMIHYLLENFLVLSRLLRRTILMASEDFNLHFYLWGPVSGQVTYMNIHTCIRMKTRYRNEPCYLLWHYQLSRVQPSAVGVLEASCTLTRHSVFTNTVHGHPFSSRYERDNSVVLGDDGVARSQAEGKMFSAVTRQFILVLSYNNKAQEQRSEPLNKKSLTLPQMEMNRGGFETREFITSKLMWVARMCRKLDLGHFFRLNHLLLFYFQLKLLSPIWLMHSVQPPRPQVFSIFVAIAGPVRPA